MAKNEGRHSKNKRECILKDDCSFLSLGINCIYNRIFLGATDFSLLQYSYCDTPNNTDDFDLKNFNLISGNASEEIQYKIPLIQRALRMANNSLKFYASPMSPPAWMKDDERMVFGGSIKGNFTTGETDYWQAYSDYLIKSFEVYHEYGIDFWATSIQNEPLVVTPYSSTIILAEDARYK